MQKNEDGEVPLRVARNLSVVEFLKSKREEQRLQEEEKKNEEEQRLREEEKRRQRDCRI